MDLAEFVECHAPALEANDIKYNLMLGILGGPSATELRLWTVGGAGACAIQSPGWPIVLGALTKEQCRQLADETKDIDLPGAVGNDDTATWFVDRAVELGHSFKEPIPQQIHALLNKPNYPGAPGVARQVHAEDAMLFGDWMVAFLEEADPHERKPSRERLRKTAEEGGYLFWTIDGRPVSMAGIVRRTHRSAAIASVYTPPSLRGRGYAGSVTAAVVERIFAEGRAAACLYTDRRNPFSTRCYAKIGFEPVCLSYHYVRRLDE